MKLQRALAIAAIIGFAVPIASYFNWRLAYASGLGKILDDWNARAELFMSAERELTTRTGIALFDYQFWDVLWVAIINVPIYMALAVIWWSIATRMREAK